MLFFEEAFKCTMIITRIILAWIASDLTMHFSKYYIVMSKLVTGKIASATTNPFEVFLYLSYATNAFELSKDFRSIWGSWYF